MTRWTLYAALLSGRLGRWLRTPLTWWEARVDAKRAHERAILQLQLEAQAGMVKAMASLMQGTLEQVANATAAQQQLFQSWLDGFKTTEVPIATTIRESDEVRAAQEREAEWMRAHGMGPGTPLGDPFGWMTQTAGPARTLEGLGVSADDLRQHLETH
jgi:hypothetical protein